MEKKRKIVFLAVNASYSHTSPSLRYLEGMIDRTKWDTDLLEITVKDTHESARHGLEALEPDVIASTFYLFNRRFLEKFFREYKKKHPECRVLCGGPEFLGDNSEFLKSASFADVVFRGEGEKSLPVFLEVFDNPEQWGFVRGICFMRDRAYIDTGFPEIVVDLDTLPFPYARFPAGPARPFVNIETSRGCSNRCVFCVSAGTGPLRLFSERRIMEHLGMLAGSGIKSVRLLDRTFNEKPARAAALLKIFREDFPGIRFHLEIDPARLASRVLAEIAKAEPGRLHIEAGVQSFKKETTEMIQRVSCPEAAKRGLAALCSMKNIEVHADLIAGLPGCSFRDLVDDLEIMTGIAPDEIQLEILKALPGTPLRESRAFFGISAEPDPPYSTRETRWMTRDEILKSGRLSVLVDRFYNNESLRNTVVHASAKIPGFWEKLLELFDTREECRDRTRCVESRFEILAGIFGDTHADLKWMLQYAWMKKGFSPHAALVKAGAFHGTLDASFKLVEGDPKAPVARAYSICAGKRYVFVYGRNRKDRSAAAVYEEKQMLQERKGPG